MNEIKPLTFQLERVPGGDDAWTTIRGLNALNEHYRKQVGELVQILARLALEHGGFFCVRNDKLYDAAIRVWTDPRDERYTRIQYLGLRDGEDHSNQEPSL